MESRSCLSVRPHVHVTELSALEVISDLNLPLFQSSVIANCVRLRIEHVYMDDVSVENNISFSTLGMFKEIGLLLYGFGVLCPRVVGFVRIRLCQQ
jgi:hypothetical protein